MVLQAKAKLSQSKNSTTMYLAIPADMVKDSQFPFLPSEQVELEIKTIDQTLVVYGDNYKLKQMAAKVRERIEQDKG